MSKEEKSKENKVKFYKLPDETKKNQEKGQLAFTVTSALWLRELYADDHMDAALKALQYLFDEEPLDKIMISPYVAVSVLGHEDELDQTVFFHTPPLLQDCGFHDLASGSKTLFDAFYAEMSKLKTDDEGKWQKLIDDFCNPPMPSDEGESK